MHGAWVMLHRNLLQSTRLCSLVAVCFVLPGIAKSVVIDADPNRAPSEFNHHIAGYALIAVGIFVLTGYISPRLRFVQFLWPFLFILAGVFLAVWSDAEIWPRGNLSWTWLLHHDQEARQHKIYAALLIGMGVVEYLRARGTLSHFWRTWSFPALAVIGGCLLLIHDHSGSSGVSSPEVRAYLVNPALDPDGKLPAGSQPAGGSATPRSSTEGYNPIADSPVATDQSTMHMDHSSTQVSSKGDSPVSTSHNRTHHMTDSAMVIEHEHFWFMVVGLAIALFKFLADNNHLGRRFVPYLWPSCTILLGVLLSLYHE